MSDAATESDRGNFREGALVEFPTEDVYTLALVTSEAPDADRRGRSGERTAPDDDRIAFREPGDRP